MDALITDDPLMAARALGLRPARFFDAVVFAQGRRLIATGDLLTPRGVSARQGCRGTITMRLLAGDRVVRAARGRLNRNCEFFFRAAAGRRGSRPEGSRSASTGTRGCWRTSRALSGLRPGSPTSAPEPPVTLEQLEHRLVR